MLAETQYTEEFLYGGDLFALRVCRLEAQTTRAYTLAQERRIEQEQVRLANAIRPHRSPMDIETHLPASTTDA